MAQWHKRLISQTVWSSPLLFVGSFTTTILIGALLLSLPAATPDDSALPFVDALFQSASAVCITGLSTVNIGTDLTRFGQIVILSLFQIGALGIMTYSLALVVFVQRRRSPDHRDWLANVFTKDRKLPPSRLLAWILTLTFVVEAVGALVMWGLFSRDYSTWSALYLGVFHAVSAFCNAGFSLFADSLVSYQHDILVNVTVCSLIIVGGLGFVVTFESWRAVTGRRRWFKLLIQTKLVLATSAVLIVMGAMSLFALGWFGGQGDGFTGRHVLPAFFQSITARTAGFNTIDIGGLSNPSLIVLMMLMFIGGGPGSTAGGVKVTTIAVLFLSFISRYRSSGQPQAFHRSIAFDTVTRAAVLVSGAVLIIVIGVFLLQITELSGVPITEARGTFIELLFETVSAFGTVGLSTGITPALSTAGKSIIIVLMFVGRVGPLTLAAILLGSRRTPRLKYPDEDVMIG